MPDEYSWDDNDDTPLVKRLRDEISKRDKALAERDKEVEKLAGQVRSQSVRDILRDMDVPPKVAALIPATVEPTPESVTKWVEEYRDVLGIGKEKSAGNAEKQEEKPVEPPAKANVSPEEVDAYRRMQNADSTGGTTTPELEQQMLSQLQAAAAAATSSDDYFAILQGRKELPTGS